MPKELKEIRGFHKGTIGSAAEGDIPDTAASSSSDINPIAQAGLIDSIREDTLHNSSATSGFNFSAAKMLGDGNKHHVITIDTSNGGDRKVKLINDLYEVDGDTTITDLSDVQGGSAIPPAMESNNKEVHIGMGTASPIWAGKVTHKQFGSPPVGYIAESGKLGIPGRLGLVHDQWLGAVGPGTYLYRLNKTNDLEKITASTGALASYITSPPYGGDTALRMCSGTGLTGDLSDMNVIFLSQNASKTAYTLNFWDESADSTVSYILDNPTAWTTAYTKTWGENISQMRLDTLRQTVYFYAASGENTVWDSDEFDDSSPVRIWRTEVSTANRTPDISGTSAIGEVAWKWENTKPILKNDSLEAEKPGQFWIDNVLHLGQWITGGGAPGLVDSSSANITNFHTCVKNFHDFAAIGEFTGTGGYDFYDNEGKFTLIEVGSVAVRGNGGWANFVFQTQVGPRLFHSGTIAVIESQSSSAFSSTHDDHAQHSLYSFKKDSKDCWKFVAEHAMGLGNGAFKDDSYTATNSGYVQWITAQNVVPDDFDYSSGVANVQKLSYSKLLSEIDEKTGLMLIEHDWARYSIVRVESDGAFVVVTSDILENTGAEDGSPPYRKYVTTSELESSWVNTYPQGRHDPLVLQGYNWPKIMGKVGPYGIGGPPYVDIEATSHFLSKPSGHYAWTGMLLSGGNAYTFGIAQDANAGTVYKRSADFSMPEGQDDQHICFMQMKKITCVGGAGSVNGFEPIGAQLALTHTTGARMGGGQPYDPIENYFAHSRRRGDLRVGRDGGVFPGNTAVITFIPDYSVCDDSVVANQFVIMSQRFEDGFIFAPNDTNQDIPRNWGVLWFGGITGSGSVGAVNHCMFPTEDTDPSAILAVYQSYPFQSTATNAANDIHSWLALVWDKATKRRYIRIYRIRGAAGINSQNYEEDRDYPYFISSFKEIYSRELSCTEYYADELADDADVDNIHNLYNIAITKTDENNFYVVESPESTTETDGISDRFTFMYHIFSTDAGVDTDTVDVTINIDKYGRDEGAYEKGITRNDTHKHTIGMWGSLVSAYGYNFWNLGSLAHDETTSDTPTEVHVNTHILRDSGFGDRSVIREPGHGLVASPQNGTANEYGIANIFRFQGPHAKYRYESSITDWTTMFIEAKNVFVQLDTIRKPDTGDFEKTWIGNTADSNKSRLLRIADIAGTSGYDGTFLNEASAVSDGIAADRRAAPLNGTTSVGELIIFQLKATGAQYDRILRINDTQLNSVSVNGTEITPSEVAIGSPDENLNEVSVEQKTRAGDVGSFYFSNTDLNGYMSLFTNDWSDNTQTFTELSEGSVNLEFTFGDNSSAFIANTRYFYCISYLYDGYQESPLTTAQAKDQGGTAKEIQVKITLRSVASGLAKRVSHIQIYRAKAADGTTTATPQGFYRLLTSIPLATGWEATGTNDVDREYDHYLDQGTRGASYSAITGMLESMTVFTPSYTVSAQLNNYHFIGNCVIAPEDDASNYVIKSMPYNFDQFNWVEDSLKLPEPPVALAAFQGKLYAFGGNTIYRIEPNNLFIEDIFHGVGAVNARSVIPTEYGMFILDRNNIYLHDGQAPRPIGRAILNGVGFSWGEFVGTSVAAFNSNTNSFIAFFNAGPATYAWNYQVDARRWDFHVSYPEIFTFNISESNGFIYGKDGELIYSNNSTGGLYRLYGDGTSEKRPATWVSKKLDMGSATQIKIFRKVIVTAVETGDFGGGAIPHTGNAYFKSDLGSITKTSSIVNGAVEYKLSGANSKGKWIQIQLNNIVVGIDSIGVVFRRRGVK